MTQLSIHRIIPFPHKRSHRSKPINPPPNYDDVVVPDGPPPEFTDYHPPIPSYDEIISSEQSLKNFIPTMDGIKKKKAALIGIWVGVAVGGTIGFLSVGPVGFLILGGAGAVIGRIAAGAMIKRREARKIRKLDKSELRYFEKPQPCDADRCQDCLVPFAERGGKPQNCGLCGRAFCSPHLRRRGYILFQGASKLQLVKFCKNCWDEYLEPQISMENSTEDSYTDTSNQSESPPISDSEPSDQSLSSTHPNHSEQICQSERS